jgi:hypothetical protein
MDDNAYESVVAEHFNKRNRYGSNIQKFSNDEKSQTLRKMFRNSFGAHSAPSEVATILWKLFGRSEPVTVHPNGILIETSMDERQSIHCDDKDMYKKISGKFLLL